MVKIIYENGCPFIDIDGRKIPPAAFRSFRPKPDNILLMNRSGVKLYQMLVSGLPCTNHSPYSLFGGVWNGEGKYNFAPFDRQYAMFEKFAPKDAYFNVMMQLDMPTWWAATHPDCESNSYQHITEAALCEEWKKAAADYMKALISYAEEKHSDRIFGYSIAAGLSNEWFDQSLYEKDYDRSHTKLTEKWREKIGKPEADVPTIASMEAGDCVFRTNHSDDYEYLKLATEGTSNLICYFAAEAQKVLQHRKLFGLFYGYVILNNQVYWNTCGYEKVWQSPDIDMLYSPADYRDSRLITGTSSYQYAVDSIRLHDKLYLHEDDHRTEIAAFPLETGAILSDCYKNFRDWREVFRREMANTMVKNAAFWWFDFFGGYYNAPEYEAELTLETKIFNELSLSERHPNAEIAVFVDPMSFLCTKEYKKLCIDVTRDSIGGLLRCGAPFEYFNLSDLPYIDLDRYKLFVFLNAYDIKPEIRTVIDNRLTDRKKVYLYAADIATAGTLDVSRTAKLCGMNIEAFDGIGLHASYAGKDFGFTEKFTPMLRTTDGNALAYYSDGSIAAADKGNVVWSALGRMPWELWRDIAKSAGVHIYDENGGGLAVCSQFVCSYTTLREDVTLHVDNGRWREVFTDTVYDVTDGVLSYRAERGTTSLFVRV